jgi:hypothetical protein
MKRYKNVIEVSLNDGTINQEDLVNVRVPDKVMDFLKEDRNVYDRLFIHIGAYGVHTLVEEIDYRETFVAGFTPTL